MATTNDVTDTTDFTGLLDKLEENMCQVVLGKRDVIRHCIVALLTGEHVLLEDVPGVGKTLVGRAIARSISGDFCRLQFTPDLLPSDIVGSTVFNSNTSEFLFQKGPVFSNLVLADEINRAPPRTQSALLEAMGDRQVSVDGKTYPLPTPFMVIATQNPFEFEGTYSLPESQLDRFLLRISMGYPDEGFERELLTKRKTKSNKTLLLRINEKALEVLFSQRELLNKSPKPIRQSPYVFPKTNGGMLQWSSYKRHFNAIREAAGIPKDYRPNYCLRDTIASMMLSDGATLDEVGYQLGHEPGSPMTRRYAQFIPDAQKRIAERSESVLNGLLSNAK